MKHIILCLLVALSGFGNEITTRGQKNIGSTWIYWDPGASDADSTLKLAFNDGKVYADSAGTWKRIDNTEDSCSYPFKLGDGYIHPVWYQALFPLIDADDDVAQNHGIRIEVRNQIVSKSTGKLRLIWDRWIRAGMNASSTDITVDDSIATVAPGTGDIVRQELRFSTSGEEARLCPSDFSGYAAGDTTYMDSIYYIGR
jgi:hypothetical protein